MPKRKMILTLGYTGIGLLGLLTLAMLFPVVHAGASATNCDPEIGTEGCLVAEAAQEVGTTVSTVLSLAMQNKVELEVVPRSNGTTSYAASKLAVSTNSHAGYSIYLQAAGEEGNLTGVTSNLSGVIKNTTRESARLEQLEANSYGYALSETAVDDNTTYSHIPTTSTAIKTTTSTAVSSSDYAYGDAYYLAFGTHIDTTLPAGQYAGSVTVSAVANPITLQSLYDITEMQQMQPEICENTKEGYTKQLIDTRDGKSYWVAKLKDGNCWMTQNLALDLDVNEAGDAVAVAENGKTVELNEGNTDIDNIWKPNNPETFRTNAVEFDGTKMTTVATDEYSWNMGKIVLATPLLSKVCNFYESSSTYDSARFGDNLAEVCRESGFVDVSSEKWSPDFAAQAGNFLNVTQPLVAAKYTNEEQPDAGGSYDAHYLIGNYYQYNAATAGTGEMVDDINQNAEGSICPMNWKLPVSGVTGSDNRPTINPYQDKGSFYQLFLAYGYPDSDGYTMDINGLPVTEIKDARKDVVGNTAAGPMYFVRGGRIDIRQGHLQVAGYHAHYWSSTLWENGSSDGRAMSLFFNIGTVSPVATTYYETMGFSVRCLAR